MKKRNRRVALLLLAALAIPLLASAQEERIWPIIGNAPSWFWFQGYDRSIGAVRDRYNFLVNDWSTRENDLQPISPLLQNAGMTGENRFVYTNKSNDEMFQNEFVQFKIYGQTDDDGKVERLTVRIDPVAKMDQAYLKSADKVMQLVLFSLFDKLPEETSRDLALVFQYDVRPFNPWDVGPHLPMKIRMAQAVVDGQLVNFNASVIDDDHLSLRVTLSGPANDEQIELDKENDRCNRKLNQVNTECVDLALCVEELSFLAEETPPNWDDLFAVSEQLNENVAVIEELCAMLPDHPKAVSYANRMQLHCGQLEDEYEKFVTLLAARQINDIIDLTWSMQNQATIMQNLINMLQN